MSLSNRGRHCGGGGRYALSSGTTNRVAAALGLAFALIPSRQLLNLPGDSGFLYAALASFNRSRAYPRHQISLIWSGGVEHRIVRQQ